VIGGVDHALWDIKGKALGVPVYELLGGPTRNRVRIYKNAGDVATAKQVVAAGFTAVKVQSLPFTRFLDNPTNIGRAADHFAEMREAVGNNIDLAVDFHGGISPAVSKILIKRIERYQPAWIEDPVQCENVDALVEVARSTYLPMCVGERLGAKWTVREVLEKRAAGLLNPDVIHAGGITELKLYAGLAETYYVDIAPHVPLGPVALAVSIQVAASIPNFLMTEHTTLGEGYLKKPFVVRDGYVDLPTAPGLGIELDEAAMASKLGKEYGPMENFDPYDGAPVDR
jgi:galactonate dehydratase